MKEEKMRKTVRERYGRFAKTGRSCCCSEKASSFRSVVSEEVSKRIGYSESELAEVPKGANLGLGCGNPVALASLKEGETVLDLGSGGGLDCFLAANKVGKRGKVIGIDMTPEMVDRARENLRKSKLTNVEFRLGEIENLPVADNSVDVVISNCVINLSPNKKRVFEEAFRVLRTGGRLMISDLVLLRELPKSVTKSVAAYVGCVAGAVAKDEYLKIMRDAGFQNVKIVEEASFPFEYVANDPAVENIASKSAITLDEAKEIARSVVGVKVIGSKL